MYVKYKYVCIVQVQTRMYIHIGRLLAGLVVSESSALADRRAGGGGGGGNDAASSIVSEGDAGVGAGGGGAGGREVEGGGVVVVGRAEGGDIWDIPLQIERLAALLSAGVCVCLFMSIFIWMDKIRRECTSAHRESDLDHTYTGYVCVRVRV